MRIERVDTYHIPVSLWADLWDREKDLPLVTPLSMYPEYRDWLPSWYWKPAMTLAVLTADDGTEGLGWCEDGCRAAQVIIDEHLERFVVGGSPFDHERIWEIMFRASIPYGRKGAAIEAISALDIAIWDLMGRAENRPVCDLLHAGSTSAMAADRGLPIICHTYSVPHLHFSVATENAPMLEHFPQPCWFELSDPPPPLFLDEPAVANGSVTPSGEPGLGLRLDRGRLEALMGGGSQAI